MRRVLTPLLLACALAACQPVGGATPPAGSVAAAPGLVGRVSAPGNLVGMDGASLVGTDGASLVGMDGASYVLAAVDERPVAGATVFLADAQGVPVPGLPTARTDASGAFAFPAGPANTTFRVVALVRTPAGKPGRLDALARAGAGAPPVRLTAGTTLVTALATEGRTGVLGELDAEGFEAAATAAEKALRPADVPDLADPKAIAAVAKALAAEVPALRAAVDRLAARLDKVEKDLASLRAEVEALKRRAAAAGSPPPPPPVDVRAWVSTALGATSGFADGPAHEALLDRPYGLAAGPDGALALADGARIRRVGRDGTITTMATVAGEGVELRHLAWDAPRNVLYAADFGTNRIHRVDPTTGAVTLLAGAGGAAARQDGTGAGAAFSGPSGLAVGPTGEVYVAEYYGATIRRITPGGEVTTLAGSGDAFGHRDGPGAEAGFRVLAGLAVGPDGRLYVADPENACVRVVDPTKPGNPVRTLAGKPGEPGLRDGTATTARLAGPLGLAVDPAGRVYVADGGNHTVRRIDAGGVVTTVAGDGTAGEADGAPGEARFREPLALAFDGPARLVVVDRLNYRLRAIALVE